MRNKGKKIETAKPSLFFCTSLGGEAIRPNRNRQRDVISERSIFSPFSMRSLNSAVAV